MGRAAVARRLCDALLPHLALLAALLNSLAFPPLRAFGGALTSEQPRWYALFWTLDALLWLHIGWQCATRRRAYVRRRLALELLATLPWDLLLPGGEGRLAFDYAHCARLLLAPRAAAGLRQLGRRTSASQVFVGPRRQLASLLFGSLVVIHWYACAMWLTAEQLELAGHPSWLTLAPAEPWHLWPAWARYVRAFDFALLTVIGDGIVGESDAEAVLKLAGRCCGVVWLAYFTSTMVSLVAMLNASSTRAHHKIAAVHTACVDAGLSPSLTARVRRHLEYVLLTRKLEFGAHRLLAELSEPLRAEVALQRCKAFFLNPKLMAVMGGAGGAHPQFIKVLVTTMEHVVFSPGDFCIEEGEHGHEVFFLVLGRVSVVANKVRVASRVPGDCIGEIALLLPDVVRTASVVAEVFSEAQKLSRNDFRSCLSDFPEMESRIRQIAEERLAELVKEIEPTDAGTPPPEAEEVSPPHSSRWTIRRLTPEEGSGEDIPLTSPFSRLASEAMRQGSLHTVESSSLAWKSARIESQRQLLAAQRALFGDGAPRDSTRARASATTRLSLLRHASSCLRPRKRNSSMQLTVE
ncbi:hypothetical protein AB1Y20_012918 [Prymnesium parvum]|uniref:Cyclic nucleotide-binding domain-containing protein n=1 Tax=Prymnesium parvum TaxID=97485 RepID=A0AB34IJR5_PRYPA